MNEGSESRMSAIDGYADEEGVVVCSTPRPFVLHIELNRPRARNAIDDALSFALADCFAEFEADPRFRVAVVSGRGSGFSAGLDLKAFLRGETAMHPERGFAGISLKSPEKPVIAAIEGFALAGGLELALACDLIVAASDARLGIPEVQRGLVADGGALLHLPRRVPYQAAMELALTGEPLSGEDAARIGLVARATEPGQAVATATALAERIAQNAPLAVRATKRVIRESRDWGIDEAWAEQDRIAAPVWRSEDAEEGARAFAEKRPPEYLGR